jgi:hypothetical protein
MKAFVGKTSDNISAPNYAVLLDGIGELLAAAHRSSARTVNAQMTARIGRSVAVSSSLNKHGRKRAGIRPGVIEMSCQRSDGEIRPRLWN